MSMIRLPNKPRGMPTQSSLNAERKRLRKKPAWDDTVTNVSAHKSTSAELVKRKAAHISQNMDLVKADKLKRKISRAQKSSKNQSRRTPNVLLQEVLQDQSQLHETLTSTDRLMAVVKDLFGDDPGKFRGLPNVTVAPNQTSSSDNLPDGLKHSHPSKLDVLSDSMMDGSALNELDESSELDTGDEEDLHYQPVMDMARFQHLLEQAEQEEEKRRNPVGKGQPGHAARSLLSQSMAERALKKTLDMVPGIKDSKKVSSTRIPDAEITPQGSPKVVAMNDTSKINKTKARITEQQKHMHKDTRTIHNSPPALDNIQDLKQVLNGLQTEISEIENTKKDATHNDGNFSNYSASLVDSVSKLTCYMKESECRLKAEATLREQLTQDLYLMKGLVDALTTDIISTQEEVYRLRIDHSKYKQVTNLQISTLKAALQRHGIELPTVIIDSSNSSSEQTANGSIHSNIPHQLNTTSETLSSVTNPSNVTTHQGLSTYSSVQSHQALPVVKQGSPTLSEIADQVSNALQAHSNDIGPSKLSASPATLLSPPRQADSKHTSGIHNVPEEVLQQVRQTLKFSGAPDNVQEIIKLQQQRRTDSEMPQTKHLAQSPATSCAEEFRLSPGRSLLHQQLAELSKQHQQAEEKLRLLMSNEQPIQRSTVSPSISPITVSPDNTLQHCQTSMQVQGNGDAIISQPYQQNGGRVITVALPRVDTLDALPQTNLQLLTKAQYASHQSQSKNPTQGHGLTRNQRPDGWCALTKVSQPK